VATNYFKKWDEAILIKHMTKERIGHLERGELGADKNASRRMNSAYAPNSQLRILT
jgi:hypothetical protein